MERSKTEEEYFAREEAEKLEALRQEADRKAEEERRKALKDLHYMHCPKCGMDLKETSFRGIMIDRCESCGGIFLDRGELEALAGEDKGGVITGILSLFRPGKE